MSAIAVDRPTGTARVESHLNGLVQSSRVPGVQYLVVGGRGVLFEYAGGWTALGEVRRVDSATTMMAYSMSKTITAVAALQLVETGRLALTESAAKYFDAFPYDRKITVGQLISHTSGIPNPIPLRWVHPASQHAHFDEAAALANVLSKHGRLSFEPGTRYGYSNIGYWLLGRIVERVSAELFTSYVHAHILAKLGLTPRELGYDVADPARHAAGYLEKYSFINLAKGLLVDRALIGKYSGRWLEIRSHYLNGPAFGGLIGTARGFGAFLQDQLREQSVLLNDATRDLLFTPARTTQGTAVPMTLGRHV